MKNTEKELPRILGLVCKPFQFILYIILQIAFIPLVLIGLCIGIYKGVYRSKQLDVSFSACRALQYKWFIHYFGLRKDPLTIAFIKKFPCESHFGLWSTMGAMILAQRLFGFTTKMGRLDAKGEEDYFSFAGPRVLAFDDILNKYVDEMEQIVLPGAGLDLSALQFTKGKNLNVFELDQQNTIDIKVETLKKAGINHDWITYIPVDYANESWVEKLLEAGFDPSKKTLFLWQSVSLFLDEPSVKEALQSMSGLCSEGSIVAQDLYSKAFISGKASKAVKKASKMIEKREPWLFGLELSENPKAGVDSFLKESGLQMTEYIQFGKKLDIKPFYCIVEAKKC